LQDLADKIGAIQAASVPAKLTITVRLDVRVNADHRAMQSNGSKRSSEMRATD
jgi:hypothetical protein